MMFKYFLALLCVWVISQTLKFLYRTFIRKEPFSLAHTAWIYIYGDGVPSTHSALLAYALWMVRSELGLGPEFYFALTASCILIYNLMEDRKKQTVLESHLRRSADPALREVVTEGKILDMSGHTLKEIIPGLILGLFLGIISYRIF